MGRTALHEVLVLNQDIRDAIINNIRKEELRELVYKKAGTISLLQDGLEKVIQGLTSIDEILRVIDVDSDFGESETELKDALIGKVLQQDSHQDTQNNLENLTKNLDTPITPDEFVQQVMNAIPTENIANSDIESL